MCILLCSLCTHKNNNTHESVNQARHKGYFQAQRENKTVVQPDHELTWCPSVLSSLFTSSETTDLLTRDYGCHAITAITWKIQAQFMCGDNVLMALLLSNRGLAPERRERKYSWILGILFHCSNHVIWVKVTYFSKHLSCFERCWT